VALSVALKMLSRCKDVFVHISAVLHDGQAIEYEEVANKGKTSAENLKVR
jgi:CspA family cold shock protein